VLDPLGMTETAATITHETRRRMAQPYRRYYDDRPSHASHGLVPATWLETNTSDGCLASSVVDLATYLRMYLNRGQGAGGRVLSELTFELMTQQVIESGSESIPGHYGYGVVTSELNDSTVLHHTGGMVGYASAMVGDLFAGLGAVAIVNGPGNPREIAWHALELLQASHLRQTLPDAPAPRDLARVENATDYAGAFRAPDGSGELTLVASDNRLVLEHGDARITLERRGSDGFFVPHNDFALFLLRFTRNESGAVTEATHGPDWFVNDRYDGPTSFDYPAEWDAFPGHYRSHNPWFSNSRVILHKGALAIVFPGGNAEPLMPLPDGSFREGDDERRPERYRFDTLVDGVALRMLHSGETFYRFFTP
ncbi:MAG: beta-lactamase family protein, partial [Chloroflexota bacterium]|nr:beta-lactamase family protein [Chloroflexota bacterium]